MASDFDSPAGLFNHPTSKPRARAVQLGTGARPGVLERDPEDVVRWECGLLPVCLAGQCVPGVCAFWLRQRREQDVRQGTSCSWAWQVFAFSQD